MAERKIPRYKSVIPRNAREVVVERYDTGAKKESSFFVARKKVGHRSWWDDGELLTEWALKDGKKHGNVLDFDANGRLSCVEPHRNGRPHGTATQFASNGSVLISYVLRNGVGLDLWCHDDGKLSEEHYWPSEGELGYSRWWNTDNKTIWLEESWLNGSGWHGILREWNDERKLRRGFPRFFVKGNRVTKRQYLRACETDPSLPPYVTEQDGPRRTLPAEYIAQRRIKRR